MLPEIVGTCKVRQAFKLSCKNCTYYGAPCVEYCRNKNINIPAELEEGAYNGNQNKRERERKQNKKG